MKTFALCAAAGLAAMAAGCTESAVEPGTVAGPAFAVQAAPAVDAESVRAWLDALNRRLASEGAMYAVTRAEWLLAGNANPASPTEVFASDHQLRLPSRWVPYDTRRLADGQNLTYGTFLPFAVANGAGPAEPAIDAAFATWGAVSCSQLPIVKRTLAGNVFPSAILSLGGFINDPFAADVATIGFLPGSIFDAFLGPGASTSVLGVTFTFAFVGASGPTDINGDGRADTAHSEIWYNNAFTWTTTGSGGIDVETVTLHEEGHALELGHFGRVAYNYKTGQLLVSPHAVMNAYILGTLRSPLGTDEAAYCGNWASWPN